MGAVVPRAGEPGAGIGPVAGEFAAGQSGRARQPLNFDELGLTECVVLEISVVTVVEYHHRFADDFPLDDIPPLEVYGPRRGEARLFLDVSSRLVPLTMSSRPSTNSRWSMPDRM